MPGFPLPAPPMLRLPPAAPMPTAGRDAGRPAT